MIKELIEFFRKNRGFKSLTDPGAIKKQKIANRIFYFGLFGAFGPIASLGIFNPVLTERQLAGSSWATTALMVLGIALMLFAKKTSSKLMKNAYSEREIHNDHPELFFHFYNTDIVYEYLKQVTCDFETLQKIRKGIADSIPARANLPNLMQLIPFTTCLGYLGVIKANSSPAFLIYAFIAMLATYLIMNFTIGMIIKTFYSSETQRLIELKDILEEIELNRAKFPL